MERYNYQAAFAGILTAEDLAQGEEESAHYAASLPNSLMQRQKVLRRWNPLSESQKQHHAALAAIKADKEGLNYSGVASKLNGQIFVLQHDAARSLHPVEPGYFTDPRPGADGKRAELFPPCKQEEWPTLVLLSNSERMSPQSFYDSFRAADALIPKIFDTEIRRLVIAGTYHSGKHFADNASKTLQRCMELDATLHGSDKMITVTEAGQMQAYRILDLLLERDDDGSVSIQRSKNQNDDTSYKMLKVKTGTHPKLGAKVSGEIMNNDVLKPVLRRDAASVLQHIIVYGYGMAHNTNMDALRALHDIISRGAVRVYNSQRSEQTHNAIKADADRLLKHARVIAVAGKDNVRTPELSRVVNFVSPGDMVMAAEGKAMRDDPETQIVDTPHVSRLRKRFDAVLGVKPLGPDYAGHEQNAYIGALLDKENKNVLGAAWERLTNRHFVSYYI